MNNNNYIEIECNINNNIKKIKIAISSDLNDEQIIKICYQVKSGNNIKELNNISYSKIKNDMILLYNGFINDFRYEINYNEHNELRIISLCNKEIINNAICFDPLLQKKEYINMKKFKLSRIKIFLYSLVEESIEWFPLTRDFKGKLIEWYSYYKGGKFESNIQYIIGNYRLEYENIDKENIYSFNNIIHFIKRYNAEKIKECYEILLNYLQGDEKEKLINQINKIIILEKKINNQSGQDELDKQKIILIFQIYEIYFSKNEFLKKNKFIISSKNRMTKDLKQYAENCFYRYFIMDDENLKKYFENQSEPKIILKSKKTDIIYTISKGEKPFIKNDKNKKINIQANYQNSQDINEENIFKCIEDYKLTLLDENQQNSFNEVNGFYQKLIEETILLPIKLKEAIKKSNDKLLEICNHNFNVMYYIYRLHKDENYTILKPKIDKFKNRFINLCNTLKKAKIDFSKDEQLYELLEQNPLQKSNFIEFKRKNIDKKLEDIWNINYSSDGYNEDIGKEKKNSKLDENNNFINIKLGNEEEEEIDDELNDEIKKENEKENEKIFNEENEKSLNKENEKTIIKNIEKKDIKVDKFGIKKEIKKEENNKDISEEEDINNEG